MSEIKQIFGNEVLGQLRQFLDSMTRAAESTETFEERLGSIKRESKDAFEHARASLTAFTDATSKDMRTQEMRTRATKEYLNVLKELDSIHHSYTARLQRQQGRESYLMSSQGRELGREEAQSKQRVANQEALWRATEKLNGTLALTAKNEKLLLTDEGRRNAVLKERQRILTALITAEERAKGALNLERARGISGVRESTQEAALQKEINRGHTEAYIAEQKRANSLAALRREMEYINSLEGRKATRLAEDIRQTKAITVEEQKRAATVARLRRELTYMTSEAGREEAQLRRVIAETRRAEESKVRLNRQLRISNQLTTAFRAGLVGLRMSIGMYTSATILTATAMYGFTRALRTGVEVGAQFTAEMQRAEAIMNALGQDSSFSALEARVVSLGRSTQFTMTQVASAATELGKIGLSAREATDALAPVLNLSIIGEMGLADSAKTATDIMLLFEKDAKDLSSVVDVMATAVTNSSASIGQLTNALTYAGASAHAAGFAFEEVVAAEMALANAGIRGSIAGTALRRAFTNLLNPTAKGAKVLDEFGIVASDAFGNTRDLQSIFGELSKSLNALPEEEKIQALSDLFGVRAASPMAALLGNIKGFNTALGQLDNSFGMADAMMDKMRDAFRFDALEVTSAMEALYTQVFQNNEIQLRVWAQQLRNAIDYMGEPLENGQLRIEAWASTLRTAFLSVAAGAAIFQSAKWIQSFHAPISETSRLSAEIARLTGGQTTAAAAASSHTAALNSQAAAASRAANSLRILNQVQASRSAGAPRTNTIVTGTSNAVSRGSSVATMTSAILTTGRGLLAAAGWVGMLVSAGYLLYEGVGFLLDVIGDSDSDLEDTTSRLRKTYDQLKLETRRREEGRESTESVDRALQSALLVRSLEAEIKALDDLTKAYEFQEETAERLQRQRTELQKQLEDAIATERTLRSELRKVDVDDPMSEVIARRLFTNFQDESYAADARLRILREENSSLDSILSDREKILEESERRQRQIQEDYNKRRREIVSRPRGGRYSVQEAQRAEDLRKTRQEEEESLAAEQAAAQQRLKALNAAAQDATQEALRQAGAEVDLSQVKSVIEMLEALKKTREEDIQLSIEQSKARFMGPLERVSQAQASYREALVQANSAQAEAIKTISEYGESLLNAKGLTGEMAEEQRRQAKASGEASRAAEKLNEAHKKLIRSEGQVVAQGVRLNKNFMRSYDALALARQNNEDGSYQLSVAYKWGQITIEEYMRSLGELNVELLKAQRLDNEIYQDLDKVIKSLGSKETQERAEKQRELNVALSEGVITSRQLSEELRRMSQPYPVLNMDTTTPDNMFRGIFDVSVERQQGFVDLADRRKAAIHDQSVWEVSQEWEHQQNLQELEARYRNLNLLDSQEYYQKKEKLLMDHAVSMATIETENMENLRRIDENYASFKLQSDLMLIASSLGMLGSISNAIYQNAEEGSNTQKAAFAAMKAMAVTSILINTEVAAMGAMAASLNGGNVGGLISGPTMVKMIRMMGYTSAGLVAGMAIAQGPKGNNSAGMFDSGGTIPRGKWGIVGEYGPEIVEGPSRVTSRKNTAHRLSGGGDVTISPVIQLDYRASGEGTAADAHNMATIVKGVVVDVIREQMRSNGMLSRR